MNSTLKVIPAVYRFFVGDLVILLGVTLTMVILALIDSLTALTPLRSRDLSQSRQAARPNH